MRLIRRVVDPLRDPFALLQVVIVEAGQIRARVVLESGIEFVDELLGRAGRPTARVAGFLVQTHQLAIERDRVVMPGDGGKVPTAFGLGAADAHLARPVVHIQGNAPRVQHPAQVREVGFLVLHAQVNGDAAHHALRVRLYLEDGFLTCDVLADVEQSAGLPYAVAGNHIGALALGNTVQGDIGARGGMASGHAAHVAREAGNIGGQIVAAPTEAHFGVEHGRSRAGGGALALTFLVPFEGGLIPINDDARLAVAVQAARDGHVMQHPSVYEGIDVGRG